MVEAQGNSNGSSNPRVPDERLRERFSEVVLPHLDAVYRLARSLAANADEAEDLVQETFVRAYQGFARFELREYGAKPWLFRILHNAFYTRVGRKKRDPVLLGEADADQISREVPVESGVDERFENLSWEGFDEEIKAAVERLPSEFRSVLLLWSLEDLSYKEIAEVCDCALGTVMSRLYRARQLLGRELRRYACERKWPTERFDG